MNSLAAAAHTVKVRLANGRLLEEELSPARQARLYSLIVHGDQFGLVEAVRAQRGRDGKRLNFPHRPKTEGDLWLSADNPDELAEFVTTFRDDYELFVTPATFTGMVPGNNGVATSQVAWIYQDDPTKLDLLREFPHRPHLVVATGGSGGVHAYWQLAWPVTKGDLGMINRKLVERLEGDRAAHNPSRILRVPGSRNTKQLQHETADGMCRIIWADLQRPGYDPAVLTEGLRDYKEPSRPRRHRQYGTSDVNADTAAKWIKQTVEIAEGSTPAEYYWRLTGDPISPRGGKVTCPFHDHEDRNPSTYIYSDVGAGWFCFSCHRGGGPFQLAAALTGWTGGELTGDDFKQAAATVAAAFNLHRED